MQKSSTMDSTNTQVNFKVDDPANFMPPKIELSGIEAKRAPTRPHKLKPRDMNVLTPSGFWSRTGWVVTSQHHIFVVLLSSVCLLICFLVFLCSLCLPANPLRLRGRRTTYSISSAAPETSPHCYSSPSGPTLMDRHLLLFHTIPFLSLPAHWSK